MRQTEKRFIFSASHHLCIFFFFYLRLYFVEDAFLQFVVERASRVHSTKAWGMGIASIDQRGMHLRCENSFV